MNILKMLTEKERQKLLPIAKKTMRRNYKEYVAFKRLIITAKFVCGHANWIEFDTAVEHIVKKTKDPRNRTVYDLFDIKNKLQCNDPLFGVKTNIMVNGTEQEFENELFKVLKEHHIEL